MNIAQVTDPLSTPMSPIEDASLTGVLRESPAPGRRYYKGHLDPMSGAFLTLLDEQGRIVFFVAGALRFREFGLKVDTVFEFNTDQLLRGITGEGAPEIYQPEMRVLSIEKGQFTWKANEIPKLSFMLGQHLPEAVSWGVLNVRPYAKKWNTHVPIGSNDEVFLSDRTWKEAFDSEGKLLTVDNSGHGDFKVRLSPSAMSHAQQLPSAWALTVVGASLFGGMSKMPYAPTPLINLLTTSEAKTRAHKKTEMETRRMEMQQGRREVEQPSGSEWSKTPMSVMRPEDIKAMESVLQGAGNSEA